MANVRSIFVIGADGNPRTGLTPATSAWSKTGDVRTPPPVEELSPGEYAVGISDDDEAVGTLVLIDFGAGSFPRRVSLAIYKGDNSNQFWCVHVENTDGTLWAGAAPTIGAYSWRNGTDRLANAPATVAVPPSSTYLFCWTPSSDDVLNDASIRVNGPAGSLQPFWSDDVRPPVIGPPPIPPPPFSPVLPPTPNTPTPPPPIPVDTRTLTYLVEQPNSAPLYTRTRLTDARLALQRGLAEYAAQLSLRAPGGREIRYQKVFEEWAEPEETAVYPAGVVYAQGAGTIVPRSMGGVGVPPEECKLPDGSYLISPGDLQTTLVFEAWANDPQERIGFGLMMESAFNPVSWMAGFRLGLPHYYGARATYSQLSVAVDDNEMLAKQRYRKLIYTLNAIVPIMMPVRYPISKPLIQLTVCDGNVLVQTEVT